MDGSDDIQACDHCQVQHDIADIYDVNGEHLCEGCNKKALLVECPFCSGSKVTPFTSCFHNQSCTECNKDGLISKAKLKRLDLL